MGGPCKPKRQNSSLVGKVASRGDRAERDRRRKRFMQTWTNPYPPRADHETQKG